MTRTEVQMLINYSKVVVFVFVTFVASSCSSPTEENRRWFVVYPGIEGDLAGVDLASDGAALAVGERGVILYSGDAGATWRLESSPVVSDLTSVRFIGQGEAIATSRLGEVLRRTNGVWEAVAYAPEATPLRGIAEASGRMIVVGGMYLHRENTSVVLTSEDRGATWASSPTASQNLPLAATGIVGVGANQWIVVGTCTPEVMCSTTIALVEAQTGAVITTNGCGSMADVASAGGGVHIAVGRCIMRSSNSGGVWSEIHKSDGEYLFAVDFGSADFGVVTGTSGVLYMSRDHGQKWTRTETGVSVDLRDVAVNANGDVIVVGDNGTIVRLGL